MQQFQVFRDCDSSKQCLALYLPTEKSIYIMSLLLSDEGPMLETLDYTIRIGSTPTIVYFDLYLYSAYAAHYIMSDIYILIIISYQQLICIVCMRQFKVSFYTR